MLSFLSLLQMNPLVLSIIGLVIGLLTPWWIIKKILPTIMRALSFAIVWIVVFLALLCAKVISAVLDAIYTSTIGRLWRARQRKQPNQMKLLGPKASEATSTSKNNVSKVQNLNSTTGARLLGDAETIQTHNCPICMQPSTPMAVTRCGHVYCKECIEECLAIKAECPTCRQHTSVKELRAIFL
ncbi:hypothetical protein FRC03_009252 [Tulasnella sp. 419]|nr:hypothetical protein FRC02_008203 [Tulasnella sp. 418]KAG8958318.1 hypothetical protein FRC03_009252 [Tulasnella sp. 419]